MNMIDPSISIPALVPAPTLCRGISSPVLCLDGTWQFQFIDNKKYTSGKHEFPAISSSWETIEVPSWVGPHHRNGFTGKYIYRKRIAVTREMKNARLLLRMEGVNGFADVFVNQTCIASHQNAFLTWNTELTEAIQGLDSFDLFILVDETVDKVSTFSHGGIIHSVFLYLLPETYVNALHITTAFDSSYHDARMSIDSGISTVIPELRLSTQLADPLGQIIDEGTAVVQADSNTVNITLPISAPQSWDAEHPRLYTLVLELYIGTELIERVEKAFGFRQIERVGNRLLVNGKEIKLRGSCRHEISAVNGRCLTKELIEEDVKLFKEANCNYIRTSHYPPSEYFLELCDRYGIYVEDELALAFIARTLDYTQQDPEQTDRYLSHFAELLSRDYSHPCVIIWSLCNESFGGYNFNLLNCFAKKADPTRVTKFSYPMTIREEYEPVDIWSIHYSEYSMNQNEERDNVSVGGAYGFDGKLGTERPVLHDEYVHVPCYNRTEHRRDPNVREFWGESIARFWNKIYNTEGALGGAIWAGIDETDVYVGGNTHLEWGIIDVWRRKKPEHYGTRKAYSPILLYGINPLTDDIEAGNGISHPICINDNKLCIWVRNCFFHTDLSETTVQGWYYAASMLTDRSIEDCESAKASALLAFTQPGPVLSPSATDVIHLPYCQHADYLYLEWLDANGIKVDEFLIENRKQAERNHVYCSKSHSRLHICDEQRKLTIQGEGFACVFDKESGLISEITRNGLAAIVGGPILHIPYLKTENWILSVLSWDLQNAKDCDDTEYVHIAISGSYDHKIDVSYDFFIHTDGQIQLEYSIDDMRVPLPNQLKLRVGTDCGGVDEIGITLISAPGTNRLSWERTGSWSVYPKDSIGRNVGTAVLDTTEAEFGTRPLHPWKDDSRHDILNGKYDIGIKGTNDFCSTKSNLKSAVIDSSDCTTACWKVYPGSHSQELNSPLHLRAEAIPEQSCIIPCTDPRVVYQGTWYSMQDNTYESSGFEMWSNEKGACASCTFLGTGIIWYAPVDVNYGYANIYIDGQKQDVLINQRIDGVDFPGSAAGYDKKYHYPVYSVTGLAYKQHTLKIEVLGTHAPDSCDSYIVLENFTVITPEMHRPVMVHLLSDFNYPHIAWGNYRRPPIMIDKKSRTGFTIQI